MLIKPIVQAALEEDIGTGDVSAALLPDRIVSARVISREPMVVAGIPWVTETFAMVDPTVMLQWQVSDGDWLDAPQTLCVIEGAVRSIVTAERTALNFLQILSGTATQTRVYVQQLKGTKTRLLDTRKTLPGLREAQKYAVRCGGGENHRMGLFDAYLMKENHLAALGGIMPTIAAARARQDGLWIEVEVETLEQLQEALVAKPQRILLDNFSMEMIQAAVELCAGSPCELEVSGGVTLENLREIAALGVDCIAVGALTKSVQAIDLSLLVEMPHDA